MVRFDPPDPFDDEIPAAELARRGAGRLAAAAPAPARRAAFRAGQPAVGTGISVLGAAAETGQPSAPTRASRRLSSPAPASLCWIKLFASIRRSPARCASAWPCAPPPPAPRWRAIARILPRCATPNISRRSGRKQAPPGASIGCGAVSPCGPSRLDAPTLRTAADLLGLSDDRQLRGVGRRLAGPRRPTPKIRSRRPRARAPRR